MPTAAKEAWIAATARRMREAEAIYFTNFRGLSGPQATRLRAELKAHGIELQVVKHTLSILAAKKAGLVDIQPFFQGPTALAYTQHDPTGPARVLRDFSRANGDIPEITGIILDGVPVEAARAAELAVLPKKDVLLALLAATVMQPMSRLVAVLTGPLTDLARALTHIKEQKTGE